MLTRQALGAAFRKARQKKGVTQKDVAQFFCVSQGSISEWEKTGRIDKKHLVDMVRYFKEVVGPEHWGLPATWTEDQAAKELASDAELFEAFSPFAKRLARLFDALPLVLPDGRPKRLLFVALEGELERAAVPGPAMPGASPHADEPKPSRVPAKKKRTGKFRGSSSASSRS